MSKLQLPKAEATNRFHGNPPTPDDLMLATREVRRPTRLSQEWRSETVTLRNRISNQEDSKHPKNNVSLPAPGDRSSAVLATSRTSVTRKSIVDQAKQPQ